MNIQTAIDFVKAHGTALELARLDYLLSGQSPTSATIAVLLTDQREDGAWSPFWAPDASSLDAICFRLAQAEQTGIDFSEPALVRAAQFIAAHQHADGYWEEDFTLAAMAPPWAKPGELSARLYLTANCGFWLAALNRNGNSAQRAADYLRVYLSDGGQLPTFPHAHWLAAGLWYRLNQYELAERVFKHLTAMLSQLAVSNLAWLITTLCNAGVPADHILLGNATDLLAQHQSTNGCWASEDGPRFDVHSTLEALRAFKLLGHFH